MTDTNPWRDAIVAALKERNRYFEHDDRSPAAILEDLLRDVACSSAHKANQELAALAGLADQLVQMGLSIRAAQQPEERNDVAITYQEAAAPFEPRIDDATVPVIEAWARGCMVQSRYRGVDDIENEWRDVGLPGRPCMPNFMSPMMEYRVKPGDELVQFCGGVHPDIKYEPNQPLDWSDAN